MSEIDHIFASKSSLSKQPPQPEKAVNNDKKKKKKRPAPDAEPDAPSTSTKRPVPVTVVDTSAQIAPPPTKRRRTAQKDGAQPSDGDPSSKEKEVKDLAQFKDSRGNADRRRTEEGWMIYKEDELGIGQDGGDTPLCPFDCDCCF